MSGCKLISDTLKIFCWSLLSYIVISLWRGKVKGGGGGDLGTPPPLPEKKENKREKYQLLQSHLILSLAMIFSVHLNVFVLLLRRTIDIACETRSPVQGLSRSVQSYPTVFTVALRQGRWSIFRMGGGGGGKSKKNFKIFAKLQYKVLHGERAPKLKIVYV